MLIYKVFSVIIHVRGCKLTILCPIIIGALVVLHVIKPKIYMKQFKVDVIRLANYYTSYSRGHNKNHLYAFYEVRMVIYFVKMFVI